MIASRFITASFVTCAATLVFACSGGSSTTSGFTGTASGNTTATGSADPQASFGNATSGDGGTGATSSSTNAACAAVNVGAQQIPVYLVVMFDRSASMAQSHKWDSCSEGLKSFFSDPKSAGLNASIQFFPATDDGEDDDCEESNYEAPDVEMTALPNTNDFELAIDIEYPGGDTPTVPAVAGALDYAKEIQATSAAKAHGKVAIVLVTDGDPDECGSTVGTVADTVSKAASTIPTYVIGIGDVDALDTIASAGGTNKAYIVSTDDPTQTASQFQNALASIRGGQLACNYQMPAAPSGQTLDLAAVNVVYTTGAGAASTLAYSKDCTGDGWQYDDPTTPTKIVLCPSTCDSVRADSSPKVDIELGCTTKGTNGEIPR